MDLYILIYNLLNIHGNLYFKNIKVNFKSKYLVRTLAYELINFSLLLISDYITGIYPKM